MYNGSNLSGRPQMSSPFSADFQLFYSIKR
jgi:hypothetical protein